MEHLVVALFTGVLLAGCGKEEETAPVTEKRIDRILISTELPVIKKGGGGAEKGGRF